MSEEIIDRNERATVLNALGDSLSSQSKYFEASKAYKEAYGICTSNNTRKIYYKDNFLFATSRVFYREGKQLIADGSFEEAAAKFQEACTTCPPHRANLLKQYRNKKAFALMHVAIGQDKDERGQEALATIEESRKLCSSDCAHLELIESVYKLISANILGDKAKNFLAEKKHEKAFFAYQSAHETCPEDNIARREIFLNGQAKSLFVGWLDYAFSSGLTLNTLEEVFQSVRSDALKMKIRRYQTLILMHVGNGYQYKGMFDRAAKEYDEAFMIGSDAIAKEFCVKMLQKMESRRGRDDLVNEFENDLVELTAATAQLTQDLIACENSVGSEQNWKCVDLMLKFLQRAFNKIRRVFGDVSDFEQALNGLKALAVEELEKKLMVEHVAHEKICFALNDKKLRSENIPDARSSASIAFSREIHVLPRPIPGDDAERKIVASANCKAALKSDQGFWESCIDDIILMLSDRWSSVVIALIVVGVAVNFLRN